MQHTWSASVNFLQLSSAVDGQFSGLDTLVPWWWDRSNDRCGPCTELLLACLAAIACAPRQQGSRWGRQLAFAMHRQHDQAKHSRRGLRCRSNRSMVLYEPSNLISATVFSAINGLGRSVGLATYLCGNRVALLYPYNLVACSFFGRTRDHQLLVIQ